MHHFTDYPKINLYSPEKCTVSTSLFVLLFLKFGGNDYRLLLLWCGSYHTEES